MNIFAGQLNKIVGLALNILVILSLLILLSGFILCLVNPSGIQNIGRPADFLPQLLSFNPVAYITLGIFLLLSTPAVCILVSLIIFLLAREKLYLIISFVVLLFSFIAIITAII
ncbi:MAG TPA: DUF1634 domain-containing protein [Dehalococcoidia bacterium]|nr:DUF1634 domain-containing protein [Dehalococcoidia bacterium]